MQWKGDQLWGTIEILPTPSGLLLWELYAQVRSCRCCTRTCAAASHGLCIRVSRFGHAWLLAHLLCMPTCSAHAQGIKLGVSSRGWASLRTDTRAKCVYVDDDFELITFDFVTEPSTKVRIDLSSGEPSRKCGRIWGMRAGRGMRAARATSVTKGHR